MAATTEETDEERDERLTEARAERRSVMSDREERIDEMTEELAAVSPSGVLKLLQAEMLEVHTGDADGDLAALATAYTCLLLAIAGTKWEAHT